MTLCIEMPCFVDDPFANLLAFLYYFSWQCMNMPLTLFQAVNKYRINPSYTDPAGHPYHMLFKLCESKRYDKVNYIIDKVLGCVECACAYTCSYLAFTSLSPVLADSASHYTGNQLPLGMCVHARRCTVYSSVFRCLTMPRVRVHWLSHKLTKLVLCKRGRARLPMVHIASSPVTPFGII